MVVSAAAPMSAAILLSMGPPANFPVTLKLGTITAKAVSRNPGGADPALVYNRFDSHGAGIVTGDVVRASVLALVVAAACATAAVAGSVFDGTWSITAVTRKGGCDPTYNFSINIAAGRITLPGYAGFSGHVAGGGDVHVSVSTSGSQVAASGTLAGSAGRGQWNSRSKDGTCAGDWTARSAR